MHPALLAAFFSTAVGGVTGAFIRIAFPSPDYWKWLSLYVVFIFYRTKIMVDDLGWYADMKKAGVQPHASDVFFAIVTWIGWFMMASVTGVSLRAFTGLLAATFTVSTAWIYAANSGAPPASPEHIGTVGFRLTRLKDPRHVRWFLVNLMLISAALLCYASASGWHDSVATVVAWWHPGVRRWVSDRLFAIGVSLIAVAFIADMKTNYASFKAALSGAMSLT